jgi:hypothetical protein
MMGSKSRNRERSLRILAGACLAGGTAIAFPHLSHADVVINVGLADFSTTTTTTNATNGGINAITYAPPQVTVPDAGSANYDAADTTDPGTIWNSIQNVSTTPTVSVSTVLYQTALPLVNSVGSLVTGAGLNVYALEGATKTDAFHPNHNSTVTGTDGLPSQPIRSTYTSGITQVTGDGYQANSSDQILMGDDWITNSTGDGMQFEVTGLTAYEGDSFSLYVYGVGTAKGSGGTFTLATGNDAIGGIDTASVNTNTAGEYLSVFSTNGGSNPAPEKGLSWNLLTGTVDSSGDVEFSYGSYESSQPAKEGMNGFQLDIAPPVVMPEPASVGLLALGSLGLLARRRPKAKT